MNKKGSKMPSRASLRSKGRIKIIPTRSNSISLRNSKQRETFVSLDSTSKKRKERTTRTNIKKEDSTIQEKLQVKASSAVEATSEVNSSEDSCKKIVNKITKKDDPVTTTSPKKESPPDTENENSKIVVENEGDRTVVKNDNDKIVITDEDNKTVVKNEDNKTAVKTEEPLLESVLPVKRKRGRPRKSEVKTAMQTSKTALVEPPVNKKIKRERTPTPPCTKQEDSPPPSPPTRRKPRMASLNAIAKVNAVLENYRFEKIKSNFEKQQLQLINSQMEKDNKKDNIEKNIKKPMKTHSKHVEMKLSNGEDTEINIENLGYISQDEKDQLEEEDNVFVSPSPLPPPPPPEQADQSIQTEVFQYSKSVQTEIIKFPNINSASLIKTLCTCCLKAEKRFAKPLSSTGFPVHVRSTVLAKTPVHTVAIPIIKNHVCSTQANEVYKEINLTSNISFLLDRCLNRTLFHKSNYPDFNKLRKMSEQKKLLDKKRRLAELTQQRLEKKKNAQRLVIPSLDCEPISISIPVSGSYRNGSQSSKKCLNKKTQKLKIEKPIIDNKVYFKSQRLFKN